jgi:hypothetical protein
VSAVLDNVKHDYETKRQPVALAEASRHLERLTEGRYTRIWTPMGQNSLCVDDRHGAALSVEKLSRGTRELVFLALRLALVSSYGRRGANMPLVLDDVFVNFDDQRAKAATSVLADIAKSGQQMLIFTCHKRIRDMFSELDADVRDLPTRTGSEQPSKRKVANERAPEEHLHDRTSQVETKTKVVVDEAELPVYDVESRDEAVDQLAAPIHEAVGATDPEDSGLPEIDEAVFAPTEPQRRHVQQFTPAWRDEWLRPLPDLADNDD